MIADSRPVLLSTPRAEDLTDVLRVLGSWQLDGGAVHLHPGDVGWHGRFGPVATAAALRVWSREGRAVAIALLDGPETLRLAIDPDMSDDAEIARQLSADISDPSRGVLPSGAAAAVEARSASLLRTELAQSGWREGDAWTPLVGRVDADARTADAGLRVETVDSSTAPLRVAIQRDGFPGSTFSLERWHAMAAGPAYTAARCLIGFDAEGTGVAAITVWSSGVGRPGLIEPLAVRPDHRGRGYGTAMARAGMRELRRMGSSLIAVATEAHRDAAVATYLAAGLDRMPDSRDLIRDR